MHVITNDRLPALESINADQLNAVTGGAGEGKRPPWDGKGLGKKLGGGLRGFLIHQALNFVTRPPSEEFKAYWHYQPEARRSRLLREAYSSGK